MLSCEAEPFNPGLSSQRTVRPQNCSPAPFVLTTVRPQNCTPEPFVLTTVRHKTVHLYYLAPKLLAPKLFI